MGACHECERTHNRDVREQGRCWCPCHRPRRVVDRTHSTVAGRWECRDCDYVTTRGADAYVWAERHSRERSHAMTYRSAS